MTNLECVIAVLASHREARRWADEAVALDLLAQLGLDAAGDAAHAAPVVDPSLVTEDEVVAAETEARQALETAQAKRQALNAQTKPEDGPVATPFIPSSHPLDLAPGTLNANAPPVPAPGLPPAHANEEGLGGHNPAPTDADIAREAAARQNAASEAAVAQSAPRLPAEPVPPHA